MFVIPAKAGIQWRATKDAGSPLSYVKCGGRRLHPRYIMCSSLLSCRMSTEISTTDSVPLFSHQCDVPFFSGATSPALCTIGTAQLLEYSITVPLTM